MSNIINYSFLQCYFIKLFVLSGLGANCLKWKVMPFTFSPFWGRLLHLQNVVSLTIFAYCLTVDLEI